LKTTVFAPTIVLITLISLTAYGQVLIGPVAGPQISWTEFNDKDLRSDFSTTPVVRYHAGVSVSLRAYKRFYLTTSLLYSKKGKVIESDIDSKLKNKVVYSHIDLPILYTAQFKGSLKGNKGFKYYIGGGPNVSYWLGGKGTIASTDIVEGGVSSIPYTVVFRKQFEDVADNEMNIAEPNRIQIGINLVAGIVLQPLGFNEVNIMLRYERGHSFLGNTNGIFPAATDYADVLASRNSGVRLSIAYMIDLKTDQRKKGKSTINKKKL
jgi:Outer membrane protein beta-barrel domain